MKVGIINESPTLEVLGREWESGKYYDAWIYGWTNFYYKSSDEGNEKYGKSVRLTLFNVLDLAESITEYDDAKNEILWPSRAYALAGGIVYSIMKSLETRSGMKDSADGRRYVDMRGAVTIAKQMSNLLYLMGIMDHETFTNTHKMLESYDNTEVRSAISAVLSYQGMVSKDAILKRIEEATKGKKYGEIVWINGQNQGGE